jgi:hypothetical protein
VQTVHRAAVTMPYVGPGCGQGLGSRPASCAGATLAGSGLRGGDASAILRDSHEASLRGPGLGVSYHRRGRFFVNNVSILNTQIFVTIIYSKYAINF